MAHDSAHWSDARGLFDRVHAFNSERMAATDPDAVEKLAVSIVEQAAKVIYNATDPPAPFGLHTGPKFVMSTARFAQRVNDDGATTALRDALTLWPLK